MQIFRKCPKCGSDSVVSAREARRVFQRSTDTRQVLEQTGARAICSACQAYKL